MKKKCTAPLSIAVVTMGLLTLTSCGNNNDTSVSAMNEIPMPTETSTIEETTSIETDIETETITTETSTIEETTPIETDTEIHSETETEGEKETDIDNETSNFEFTISPLSQTMYTQKDCNVRKKPSTEYEILDCLNKATEVKVTGKVNEADWYEVSIGEEKGYIASSLLADTKPTDQQTQTQNPPVQPSVTTNTPDENGTYTDENGYTHAINPETGDYFKNGDTNPQGWIYHDIPGF